MIIFFKSGELGNQIFQYLAIKKYDNSSRIITFGLDEINDIFDPNSSYGMTTSGQSTVREGKSVGDRYLTVGRNREINIAHINRMRAELKNTSHSLFGNEMHMIQVIKDMFFL